MRPGVDVVTPRSVELLADNVGALSPAILSPTRSPRWTTSDPGAGTGHRGRPTMAPNRSWPAETPPIDLLVVRRRFASAAGGWWRPEYTGAC